MKTALSHCVPMLALALTVAALNSPAAAAEEGVDKKAEKKITEALSALSDEDRKLAKAQRFCPMMPHSRLGAMGTPIKLTVLRKPVFVCCKGCAEDAVKGGAKTLRTAKKLVTVTTTLAKLSPEERTAAEAQKYCAVANTSFLGSMGAPIKLVFDGKPVYLCCEGCESKAKSNPAATLAKVEQLKKSGKKHGHGDHHDHADHK